jgi:hypothetical protein
MAKHAEVIYETGAKSVVAYDDEAELQSFVAEHTERALTGKPGAAQDYTERTDIEPELARQAHGVSLRPAERISKVLLYDRHPLDYAQSGYLYASTVDKLIVGLKADNNTINVWELIAALRREINATHTQEVGPHDSHYKVQQVGELDLSGNGGSMA